MKIVAANGKRRGVITKKEWEAIGKKAGRSTDRLAVEAQVANPAQAQQTTQTNQAAQPNQAAQTNNEWNPRSEAIVDWYNLCTEKNLPVTLETYNQLGRSGGIIKAIAGDPAAFHRFVMRQSNTTPEMIVRDLLTKIVGSISRTRRPS